MSSWADLRQELAIWDAQGLSLRFWWRDDDAVADTPALRRLTKEAEQRNMPLGLAVIPAHLEPSLPDWVADHPDVVPLVHGWAHENHENPPNKKMEFGPARPLHLVQDDAARGLATLQAAFGARLSPIFVPPWNRMRPDLAAALPGLGFRALSTFLPRKSRNAAPDLAQINTHIDPIDWRGSRSLVAPDEILTKICALLQERRTGQADIDEPLGLLTHHLVHDDAIWSFCAKLSDLLLAGPARPWHPEKDPTP